MSKVHCSGFEQFTFTIFPTSKTDEAEEQEHLVTCNAFAVSNVNIAFA